MTDQESPEDRERWLRRAAVTAFTQQAPEPLPEDAEEDEDDSAPAQRMEQQALWVDLQVRRAMERGEFDDLPGAGKPIRGLDGNHDPNWWVKSLIEREQITGVLPPALALRKEDAELDGALDREASADGVRRADPDAGRLTAGARVSPAYGGATTGGARGVPAPGHPHVARPAGAARAAGPGARRDGRATRRPPARGLGSG